MSLYTQISKEIGWEPREVQIPTIAKAQRLKEMVIKRHCKKSFKKVFELHRFVKTTHHKEHYKAMEFIYHAYEKGTEIFKGYHA